jgi:hypothetical protein
MPFRNGLAAVMLLIASSAASAGTITIETYSGSGYLPTPNGWEAALQTFETPAGFHILDEYQFTLAARDSDGTVAFGIYAVDAAGPTGPALYDNTAAWGTTDTDVIFSNINLSLVAGTKYAAVVDFLGYDGPSLFFVDDSYSDGIGMWFDLGAWYGYPENDNAFRAVFKDDAQSVPDGGSALAMLGLGVIGLGVGRRFTRI